MPLYDYRCTECKHEFEEQKRLAQYQETTQCPECGYVAERIRVAPAFKVRGGTPRFYQ